VKQNTYPSWLICSNGTLPRYSFFAEKERIVSLARMESIIAPYYPKTKAKGGRQHRPLI